MSKYKIKQKFLSISERFNIENEYDERVFSVKGKFFSVGKKFDLFDKQEQPVAAIKQKLLAFRPTYYIEFNDGSKAKIVKTFFPLFHSRFLIEYHQQSLTVLGNFLSHEYQISEQEQVIAEVSKQWFSLSDTYGVDIVDDQLAPLILSVVIIIDAIHHNGSDD